MTATINKTNVRTHAQANENTVGKATIAMFGGASLIVGVWAAACFVGAIAANGPAGLVQGFITAVTGV